MMQTVRTEKKLWKFPVKIGKTLKNLMMESITLTVGCPLFNYESTIINSSARFFFAIDSFPHLITLPNYKNNSQSTQLTGFLDRITESSEKYDPDTT